MLDMLGCFVRALHHATQHNAIIEHSVFCRIAGQCMPNAIIHVAVADAAVQTCPNAQNGMLCVNKTQAYSSAIPSALSLAAVLELCASSCSWRAMCSGSQVCGSLHPVARSCPSPMAGVSCTAGSVAAFVLRCCILHSFFPGNQVMKMCPTRAADCMHALSRLYV